MMLLSTLRVSIVPADQNESEKSLCDGVTKVFTVKKYEPTIKHQLLERRLVQQHQNSTIKYLNNIKSDICLKNISWRFIKIVV